jgi:hypothetical protein
VVSPFCSPSLCLIITYAEAGSPTLNALGRACTKSLGSLAFGALILAICDFMSLLLRIADRVRTHHSSHVNKEGLLMGARVVV